MYLQKKQPHTFPRLALPSRSGKRSLFISLLHLKILLLSMMNRGGVEEHESTCIVAA